MGGFWGQPCAIARDHGRGWRLVDVSQSDYALARKKNLLHEDRHELRCIKRFMRARGDCVVTRIRPL